MPQNVAPHGQMSVRHTAPEENMSDALNGLESPKQTASRDLSHANAPSCSKDWGAGARVTASHSLSNTPERVISSLIETNES